MHGILSALIAALFSISVFAGPVQIAPLAPMFGDMQFDDISPRAASDSISTLVVWVNAFSPYAQTDNVLGALVDRDGAPTGLPFAITFGATRPRVASNGNEYLVAYGEGIDRFNTSVVPNVAVRIVKRDGTVGAEQVINKSNYNYASAGDVVWAGDHWIVVFFDATVHVAFLDHDLQMLYPTIDLGGSQASLAMVAGKPYIFDTPNGVLEAREIAGGALVPRGSQPIASGGAIPYALNVAATSSGAIVALALQAPDANPSISIETFSPLSGFSPPTATLDDRSVMDLATFDDGALLLHVNAQFSPPSPSATRIDAGGNLVDTQIVIAGSQISNASLAPGLAGPLLLLSIAANSEARKDDGVYAVAFDSLHSVRTEDLRLVSVTRVDAQSSPLICTAGSYAAAVWNQTVDNTGRVAAFTRRIDATGNLVGDPIQLPFSLGQEPDIACTSQRVMVAWDGKAVSLAPDGSSVGPVVNVPSFSGPRIAATDSTFFAMWMTTHDLFGSPVRSDGSPAVPNGFPLLPSLRPQTAAEIAPLGDSFVVVWLEDSLAGSMLLSGAGTPGHLQVIGANINVPMSLGGNVDSAMAGWLSDTGSPRLVAIDATGGSFDLFDPHWGEGYSRIAIHGATGPSRFFVGLVKQDTLVIGETQQMGSFITGLGPLHFIETVGADVDFTVVSDAPVAIWTIDNRVFVSGPSSDSRRRIARNH